MSNNYDDIRALAAKAYNSAFELIESGNDPLRAIELSAASLYYWREIGTDQNLAIGYWLYSRALVLAQNYTLAIEAAEKSLKYTAQVTEAPDWLIASSYEGFARALAASNDERASAAIAHTQQLIDAIADSEDRALIAGQFADLCD